MNHLAFDAQLPHQQIVIFFDFSDLRVDHSASPPDESDSDTSGDTARARALASEMKEAELKGKGLNDGALAVENITALQAFSDSPAMKQRSESDADRLGESMSYKGVRAQRLTCLLPTTPPPPSFFAVQGRPLHDENMHACEEYAIFVVDVDASSDRLLR